MDAILRNEGLLDGTPRRAGATNCKAPRSAVFRIVTKAVSRFWPNTNASWMRSIQRWISTLICAQIPVWKLNASPSFSEETAPGAYYQPPSLDGKRKGAFFANLRNVEEIPRFWYAYAGLSRGRFPAIISNWPSPKKLEGLPMFRRLVGFTAYSEGWALYAEQLAWELGFQDDPLDNLGRLQAEMFRAVRLVVDTGLHAKHWNRERAIDYMLEHTGMGEEEVVAEIERYLVNPGQALAYKIGMLKILELRETRQSRTG